MDAESGSSTVEHRRAEIVARLGAVRSQIADACTAAGRDARSITLVAVTKTYPAADVATLIRLGVLDVGESRDQEASAKIAEVAALLAARRAAAENEPGGQERGGYEQLGSPRWHFVGRLQSRKARSVAGYAQAVHSLDRSELVSALADAVARAEREPLEVFVQVSLDGDPDRGGVPADGLAPLADAVAGRPELVLRGVMAVAPLGAEPDVAFARLAEISADLRAHHPEADRISAGMSGDLDAAVRHGSTHVRVGSALLGRRTPGFG